MFKLRGHFILATFAGLTLLSPASLQSQSLWLDRSQERAAALEVLRADFDGDSNSGWLVFLSSRVPFSNNFHLVSEVPFSSVSFKSESESAIGNPYVGVEIGGEDLPIFVELGIRLPLASEDKPLGAAAGFSADIDRLEAFAQKVVPASAMINFYHESDTGFQFRLRGGTTLSVKYDAAPGEGESHEFIGYSAQAGYRFERLGFMVGFSGRANLSTEDLNYGQRSLHQLGFNLSAELGKLRSGLLLRLPRDDDLKSSLDAVFGAQLSYPL
jgi:hypothetical protein